jgi:hypothetical protein
VVFQQRISDGSTHWKPFKFSLNSYAGQTVIITLKTAAEKGSSIKGGWYRFPSIDLKLENVQEPFRPSYSFTSRDLDNLGKI